MPTRKNRRNRKQTKSLQVPGIDGEIQMGQQLLTKEEIEARGGTIIDEEMPAEVEIGNLPDPTVTAATIVEIITRSLDDDLVQIQKTQPAMYERLLSEEFPEFAKNNFDLFRMVISVDDPLILCQYLHNLDRVKNKEISFQDAANEFGDMLDETYLYPTLSTEDAEELRRLKREKRQQN